MKMLSCLLAGPIVVHAFGSAGLGADTSMLLTDKSATGLGGECKPNPKVPANKQTLYGNQVRCKSKMYGPASTWVKQVGKDEDYVFDLAIIGGGVGSAYLVNEVKKKNPNATIAVFEASDRFGGRLMSAYGSGGLGEGVQDLKREGNPPPEYGGMRIDPLNHWLVWDAINEVTQATTGKACGRTGEKKLAPIDPNLLEKFPDSARMFGGEGDCDSYMVQMTTSTMRYAAGKSADPKKFGDYLLNATFTDDGVIHNRCLSLIGATSEYAKQFNVDLSSKSLADAVQETCDNCNKVNTELCDTCKLFPDPGANLVSCIGYDDLTQVPAVNSLTDASAVTGQGDFNCDPAMGSTDKCSKLYLFRHGAQRFAMDLFNMNGENNAGPIFGKTLVGIDMDGVDLKALAKDQASNSQDATTNDPSETPTEKGALTLRFEDNSVARAKAVYLTVLPTQLVDIEGFQAWVDPLRAATLPFGATKLFIYWKDGMPQEIKDATKSGGIRLVTDGNRPGQMARQIFFWDENTILVYQTAPTDSSLPANVMQEEMQQKGMDEMMYHVMTQLEDAFRKPLPQPTWARVKAWANGALSYYKTACGTSNCKETVSFTSKLQRPMGQSVPVFYGNSEMSGNGGSPPTQGTGWIMGSFQQVQLHLDAILKHISN